MKFIITIIIIIGLTLGALLVEYDIYLMIKKNNRIIEKMNIAAEERNKTW